MRLLEWRRLSAFASALGALSACDGSPDSGAGASTDADLGAEAAVPDAGDQGARQAVTLRFRAQLGDAELDCNERYPAPGGGEIAARDFRFYISDVALIDRDGREVKMRFDERDPWQTAEVALIDFEDATGSCTQGNPETNREITGTVPKGDYRGLVFSNGVPPALNHADPLKLPAPLQVGTLYWSWLQGFKFIVAETEQLPTDDAPGAAAGFGVLHLGSVGCAPPVDGAPPQCSLPNRNRIQLDDFDPSTSTIVADLSAVFADAGNGAAFCHGLPPNCAPVYRNLGLDISTGANIDTQRVYRVE